MLVKLGSSSPSFGVKIPKIFELPPPSYTVSKTYIDGTVPMGLVYMGPLLTYLLTAVPSILTLR